MILLTDRFECRIKELIPLIMTLKHEEVPKSLKVYTEYSILEALRKLDQSIEILTQLMFTLED